MKTKGITVKLVKMDLTEKCPTTFCHAVLR